MSEIYPVLAGRITDTLMQRRLISQFDYDRSELVRLQDQLSTGYRISSPSDDAPSALRAITLQRLLEQKSQVKTNLDTSQSYLAATDNALVGVSDVLINIRAEAVGAVDVTTNETQRAVLVQEIQGAIDQLADIGNHKFRDRFLFAGSDTTRRPFEFIDDTVKYLGNERRLQSFVDLDLLADTNATGAEVFGAFSPEKLGTADLNPAIMSRTKLNDLQGGAGIARGSFLISDGTTSRTIDIQSAETVGDVVRLLEANPPDGRTITVNLTSNGLAIDIDDAGGGNLSIREVGLGTTALELGILNVAGIGTGAIVGNDVNPRLLPTTRLGDVLGVRAQARLEVAGGNNNIFIEAPANGTDLNGVLVQFTNVVAAGDQAFATYNAGAKTLTIDIAPGATTANKVVQAIIAEGTFSASLAKELDGSNDGTGLVSISGTALTAGGSGVPFDPTGIQIVNGNATHVVTFGGAETIEDVLNALNVSSANVLATVNASGNGIDIRSRLSGVDFTIGENGGGTAEELGVRTFTRETRLEDLNFGVGVSPASGVDFQITRRDGTVLDIDISSPETIGDVLDIINQHPNNQDVNRIVAQLVSLGNGIELVDNNTVGGQIVTVTRVNSFAAVDLGFLARGENQATAPADPAADAISFAAPNNTNTALRIFAVTPGTAGNGVTINFVDAGAVVGNVATVNFNAGTSTLTFDIDQGTTTAVTAINAINSLSLPFEAELDATVDLTNDGSGFVGADGNVGVTAGGAERPFRSRDVNAQETKGVFNSLLRLSSALQEFDLPQIERAVAMLDVDFERLTFARGEVGARERTFDTLRRRHENEEIELKSSLSLEIDADLVKTISDLTARQASIEATLCLVGQSLTLSVLDFL
ncbi:MAG TPA: flagellar hook-associated protein FlgL [Pirellulaceae bacterium]|nr:flagellar hook-associated protein FlgL [Pirellulaceae bacterium]